MDFQEKRGIGYCGLACVLCSWEDCPGCCKAKIAGGGGCSSGKCAAGKGVNGCHACPDYASCAEDMPHVKDSRAFNRYAQEFGIQALVDRLRVNYENGITYQAQDGSAGDYGKLETEEEIYRLLRYGLNDPYAQCPEFETEHFKFRQVAEKDAEELLSFYGDLSGWMFYGNDMCKSIFASRYATMEEMQRCIRYWLDEYKNKFYIRFSMIDKATNKAVGTIEMFDNIGKGHTLEAVRRGAALHIDLSAPYETRENISELLILADKELFVAFGTKYLLIRAVPSAEERIAALLSAWYQPFKWEPSREYFYIKEYVNEDIYRFVAALVGLILVHAHSPLCIVRFLI